MAKQTEINHGILSAALSGLEFEKARLEAAISEIKAELGHRAPGRPPKAQTNGAGGVAPKKRTMSASARKRIALAQKRRWAAFHKQTAEPAKPKRRMSAAGRKAIGEATRKRWAAYRKANANA